jgi:hypothetical protein
MFFFITVKLYFITGIELVNISAYTRQKIFAHDKF